MNPEPDCALDIQFIRFDAIQEVALDAHQLEASREWNLAEVPAVTAEEAGG